MLLFNEMIFVLLLLKPGSKVHQNPLTLTKSHQNTIQCYICKHRNVSSTIINTLRIHVYLCPASVDNDLINYLLRINIFLTFDLYDTDTVIAKIRIILFLKPICILERDKWTECFLAVTEHQRNTISVI